MELNFKAQCPLNSRIPKPFFFQVHLALKGLKARCLKWF